MANIPACLIGVEASTGAFYWQREFEKLGHKVKVISPQYVKPFVRGQKNDGNGAQAIAVDLMQPTMQFVPPKSPEQQDIQALHRARQRIGKGTEFKNGRHFAAWLGLVPRQHSSGDR